MKNIIPHLLVALVLSCGVASSAEAQKRPKAKPAKRAFTHSAESGKGKTSKARFRRESERPVIDLNPNSLVKTKTTKAPKPYKFSNGNGFKPVK